jgi:hypothetical protein
VLPIDPRAFTVLDTGQVVADGTVAAGTAEALLYVARIADAVGYHLGAGDLERLEVFGRSSAIARVDHAPDGSPTLTGCAAPAGSSSEELEAWLATGQGR